MKHNLLIVSIVMVIMSLSCCSMHSVGFAEFDVLKAGGYCDLSYEIKADPEEDEKDACYREWKKCSADETTWSKSVCGPPL